MRATRHSGCMDRRTRILSIPRVVQDEVHLAHFRAWFARMEEDRDGSGESPTPGSRREETAGLTRRIIV